MIGFGWFFMNMVQGHALFRVSLAIDVDEFCCIYTLQVVHGIAI